MLTIIKAYLKLVFRVRPLLNDLYALRGDGLIVWPVYCGERHVTVEAIDGRIWLVDYLTFNLAYEEL